MQQDVKENWGQRTFGAARKHLRIGRRESQILV